MYTKGITSGVVVGVYVDDLVITGARPMDVDAFKGQMCRLFRMSDLGLLSFYFRLEIKHGRDPHHIGKLGQAAYACKLLEKAGMGKF